MDESNKDGNDADEIGKTIEDETTTMSVDPLATTDTSTSTPPDDPAGDEVDLKDGEKKEEKEQDPVVPVDVGEAAKTNDDDNGNDDGSDKKDQAKENEPKKDATSSTVAEAPKDKDQVMTDQGKKDADSQGQDKAEEPKDQEQQDQVMEERDQELQVMKDKDQVMKDAERQDQGKDQVMKDQSKKDQAVDKDKVDEADSQGKEKAVEAEASEAATEKEKVQAKAVEASASVAATDKTATATEKAAKDKAPVEKEKAKTAVEKPVKPKKPVKKKDSCCCKWVNCAELQSQLYDGDLRKGLVAIPNVSGALQKSFCRHLGVEPDTPPQRFVIAKHHWPLALLQDNMVQKRRWTTPLTLLEACRLLHMVEKKDSYKQSTTTNTHDIVYCQAPNVPLQVVEQACWSDDADDEHEAARILNNRNEIIERLLKENAKLKANSEKSKDTNNTLAKQLRKLEKIKSLANSPHWISTNTLLEFLNNHYGGLTRYTIQSDEWHANNPNAAKELFGYPTWAITKEKICERFPTLLEKGPLVTPPRMFQSKKGVLQLDDVSEFEKCLCVKLMDRTGLTKTRAALLFGRQDRTVTYWRQAWCPQWGIARDGLEQSKHKAHLNQSTRKTPRKPTGIAATNNTKKMVLKKRKSPTPDEDPGAAAAAAQHPFHSYHQFLQQQQQHQQQQQQQQHQQQAHHAPQAAHHQPQQPPGGYGYPDATMAAAAVLPNAAAATNAKQRRTMYNPYAQL
ncbi:expressed unknown protein [Seminavis robusta]|uniref:Uncharacterized protein n=1 Tax=Seminavis robusta TaxID=568900 RepID=A0A9N8E600_9STRA|nr:expressed unknown protein [Seminavis robusta]|eukprot:Sro708_g190760.1 n/a (735) ;mRNA; f:39084-41691